MRGGMQENNRLQFLYLWFWNKIWCMLLGVYRAKFMWWRLGRGSLWFLWNDRYNSQHVTIDLIHNENICNLFGVKFSIWIAAYLDLANCEFAVGDTTGGEEQEVTGAKTEQDCAANVRLYKPHATGATWQPSTKWCWGEFGNTIDSSSAKYRTCLFKGRLIRQTMTFGSLPKIHLYTGKIHCSCYPLFSTWLAICKRVPDLWWEFQRRQVFVSLFVQWSDVYRMY